MVAKGQCESSGAFIGPGLVSRGFLPRGRETNDEGRKKGRRGREAKGKEK